MPYIKERLNQAAAEEVHNKYGFVNPVSDRPVAPLQWAINHQTNSFFTGIGGGTGYRAGPGDRTPVYGAFLWKEAGCKVIYSWEIANDAKTVVIVVTTLVIPESVRGAYEALVKDLSEALLCYFGTHGEFTYHLDFAVREADFSLLLVKTEEEGRQYVW